MKTINLTPTPLTSEVFSSFGDVIDAKDDDFMTINNGYARKYADLASIDTQEADGITAIHIFVAKKRRFPLNIDMLENHPFFSQAFIPRGKQPFIIVVAPAGNNIRKYPLPPRLDISINHAQIKNNLMDMKTQTLKIYIYRALLSKAK